MFNTKKLLFLVGVFLVVVLVGIGSVFILSYTVDAPNRTMLGEELYFSVGKKMSVDGLSVTLTKVNDSRCKSGVVCIWAGELSPVFTVTYSDNESVQIILGTMTAKEVSKNGYTFSLKNATENSATIVVTKN